MELRDYQKKAVAQVQTFMRALDDCRTRAIKAGFPDLDFPAEAWRTVLPGAAYRSRRDGAGKSIPSFCLKIPTGGGKTLLAVKCIDAVNTLYVKRRTGLALWVVPTTQIYDQTLKSLRDRNHPYRQHLDVASAGRTVIVEKHERFSPSDVEENLVVLLLMLPSAAKATKERLRMFKDNGGFESFFPADDARKEHEALLLRVPNLDTFDKEGFWGSQLKTSLGNTLRLLRPILIVDEGQKAYSQMAQETLNGFNPSVLIELSATPPGNSNILVDIKGTELAEEEMIKLPLNVIRKGSPQWHDTLAASVTHREKLEKVALRHEAASGTHIRPICLVQAERVGEKQKEKGFVHAEDVRERLIKTHGIPPEQIAVKTSEKDELAEVDDVGGLMSRDCQIRYIITKQALQEGWDCPFAYVLTVLTNPKAKMAMTQLVGRVLRQPFARKTHVKELDESYVFCHRPDASELLQEIRRGLTGEGLEDLAMGIVVHDGDEKETVAKPRVVRLRKKFAKALKSFALPVFAVNVSGMWRPVRYETDIEARIPWDKIDVLDLCADLKLSEIREKDDAMVLTLGDAKTGMSVPTSTTDYEIDEGYVARHVVETIPNPWAAYDFGRKLIECLAGQYDIKLVHGNFAFIVEELRKHLAKAKEKLAKDIFLSRLKKGEIRFMLITGAGRLPDSFEVPRESVTLNRRDGTSLEKSLHDFAPQDAFNGDEKQVAWFLEDQERMFFWYRNRVKSDYSIQGWRKERFWPDFIFSAGKKDTLDKVYVVETKGDQLAGSEETLYKQALVELCNAEAKKADVRSLPGIIGHAPVEFQMLKMSEWEKQLKSEFAKK